MRLRLRNSVCLSVRLSHLHSARKQLQTLKKLFYHTLYLHMSSDALSCFHIDECDIWRTRETSRRKLGVGAVANSSRKGE